MNNKRYFNALELSITFDEETASIKAMYFIKQYIEQLGFEVQFYEHRGYKTVQAISVVSTPTTSLLIKKARQSKRLQQLWEEVNVVNVSIDKVTVCRNCATYESSSTVGKHCKNCGKKLR